MGGLILVLTLLQKNANFFQPSAPEGQVFINGEGNILCLYGRYWIYVYVYMGGIGYMFMFIWEVLETASVGFTSSMFRPF
jgi:hypothetical protein